MPKLDKYCQILFTENLSTKLSYGIPVKLVVLKQFFRWHLNKTPKDFQESYTNFVKVNEAGVIGFGLKYE